ncbi:Survival motor neuron SMN interacting protein 1 SIP1 [Metschnikowia aff. pulcherrima]|uniref:Survival motor neuron SMN interacting protein 1 SIP1 n=1 Tax=Metschnikowia aff. pulcherrima TaxID=2163413 RepID=A0A4P6XUM0_9ASCO|nr:Survival motor neuron SMN interacting protein 1 SIP1 [Metschnikowia aff. pulcherrima]
MSERRGEEYLNRSKGRNGTQPAYTQGPLDAVFGQHRAFPLDPNSQASDDLQVYEYLTGVRKEAENDQACHFVKRQEKREKKDFPKTLLGMSPLSLEYINSIMSRLIAEKEKEKSQIIPKEAFGETISVAQLDFTSAGDSEPDEGDVLVHAELMDAPMTEGDSKLPQKDDILAKTAANGKIETFSGGKHAYTVESDPWAPFRMYSIAPRSWLRKYRSSEKKHFLARPLPPCESPNLFNFRDFVPYQLSVDNLGLFPEFYLYFVASFSKLSDENRAYCLFKREKFELLFLGEEEDINRAVYSVERDFSEKFRSCLDPQVCDRFYAGTHSRPIVETKFKELIIPHIQPHTIAVRETKLASAALEGDLVPYVYFLMAYEHGHDYIWAMVAKRFARYATSHKQIDLFNEAVSRWSTEKNFNILDCIDKFVDELIDEGILSQELENMRKNSTRDIFFDLNLADESRSFSIGNDEFSDGHEHPEKRRKISNDHHNTEDESLCTNTPKEVKSSILEVHEKSKSMDMLESTTVQTLQIYTVPESAGKWRELVLNTPAPPQEYFQSTLEHPTVIKLVVYYTKWLLGSMPENLADWIFATFVRLDNGLDHQELAIVRALGIKAQKLREKLIEAATQGTEISHVALLCVDMVLAVVSHYYRQRDLVTVG